MNFKSNSLVASFASVFVIFVAMMSPVAAILISFFALLYLALRSLQDEKGKSFAQSATVAFIVAACTAFGWAAIRDIIRGGDESYTLEILGLVAVFAVLLKLTLILRKKGKK